MSANQFDQTVHPVSSETDLLALLGPLRKRLWLILAAAVVAAAATYFYFDRKPDQYRATTSLYAAAGSDADALINGFSVLQQTDRSLSNQATLLRTAPIAREVAKRINYQGDPRALLGAIDVQLESGRDFLTINAVSNSAQDAARIANGFASAYVDARTQQNRAAIQSALDNAQKQLSALGKDPGVQQERDSLRTTISRLRATLETASAAVRQLDPAGVPGAPFAPKPVRNAIFALIVALVLAIGLAYLLDRLDQRLKDVEQVERAYGMPLISVIPHARKPRALEDGKATLDADLREAFRGLHTNLRLLTLDDPIESLLVTSALPGEGKSTVARNLALAYREWGVKVILVEADLRRPTLAESLGAAPEYGLTHVLDGSATLDQALHEVDVRLPGLESATDIAALTSRDVETIGENGHGGQGNGTAPGSLSLLAAGRQPANPQAVIASERMTELLAECRERCDILVVDTSPLLAVSDALPLLSSIEATVLVSRVEVSTRGSTKRSLETLRLIPDLRALGVVANDIAPSGIGDSYSSGYGYGYGYGYGSDKLSASRGRSEIAAAEAERLKS